MILYTMGFTQKTAEQFFDLIRANHIELLIDIRLNNKSQLAGFSKGEDLRYFLKEICNCRYEHCIEFAPTKEILDGYKKGKIDWDGYVSEYLPLMNARKAPQRFLKRFGDISNVCLLCSEPTPERCHRRLLAEMINKASPNDISVVHI